MRQTVSSSLDRRILETIDGLALSLKPSAVDTKLPEAVEETTDLLDLSDIEAKALASVGQQPGTEPTNAALSVSEPRELVTVDAEASIYPSDGEDVTRTIVVSNLPHSVAERHIKELYEQYGTVASIKMLLSWINGGRIAEIQYENEKSAADALFHTHGTRAGSVKLSVRWKKDYQVLSEGRTFAHGIIGTISEGADDHEPSAPTIRAPAEQTKAPQWEPYQGRGRVSAAQGKRFLTVSGVNTASKPGNPLHIDLTGGKRLTHQPKDSRVALAPVNPAFCLAAKYTRTARSSDIEVRNYKIDECDGFPEELLQFRSVLEKVGMDSLQALRRLVWSSKRMDAFLEKLFTAYPSDFPGTAEQDHFKQALDYVLNKV